MITLYKNGKTCSCSSEQFDVMLENGWSAEAPAVAKEAPKAVKKTLPPKKEK